MKPLVTTPDKVGRDVDPVTENQNKIPAANEPQPEKSAKNKLMAPPTVPWDQPVEGHVLLDALVSQFKRHLSLPDGATDAMALWVVFTHAFDAMYVNPRLSFISPAPGCGKTTALSMLKCLVSKPVLASNITPAVVFRIIQLHQPTLLADEADTYLQDRDGLKGILNSGHTKAGALILRSMGDNHEPTGYSTWAPMAIAKIGKLPATLHDRSVVIRMQRALRNEKIEKFWGDADGQLNMLASKAARWASDNLQKLRGAEPQVPGDLLNRAADNWLPLLAIADAVGGH